MQYTKFLTTKLVVALLIFAGCLDCATATAKKKITDGQDIYRRNSLCTYFISNIDLLVSEDGVPEEIKSFLDKYQVSDKFDDHTIGSRYVSVNGISFSDEDRAAVDEEFAKHGGKKKKKGGFLTAFMTEEEKARADQREEEGFISSHPEIFSAKTKKEYAENTMVRAAQLYRYLLDTKFANQLVAKWFNAQSKKTNGSHYDLSLIQERGLYNASELDMLKAAESTRRWAVLQDAGMELIPHTFVSFTHFEIIDGRKYWERLNANSDGTTDKVMGGLFGKSEAEMKKIDKKIEAETAGYYITATTYLFQLEWSEEMEEKFINEYWNADLSKLMNSEDFHLKYLGYERNTKKTTENVMGKGLFKQLGTALKEGVASSIAQNFGGYSAEEAEAAILASHESARQEKTLAMTEQALVRSIDQTYADLQKSHEEFRVKAPLIDVSKDGITAFIGLKEGITKKSEFEVLERVYNKKKGIFEYKKAGKLEVDGKRIWDNRYTLDELADEKMNVVGKGKKAVKIDRTYFGGSTGGLAPGMLLRQVK